MGGLFSLVGYLVGGWAGLLWFLFFWTLMAWFSPQLPPSIVLRLSGAHPLLPWQAPRLYAMIRQLGRRAGLAPFPQLYLVPGFSFNAFSGGDREQRSYIALSDGILHSLTERELVGVLAHEISHIKGNDLRVMGLADQMSRLTSLMSFAGFFLLLWQLPLVFLGQKTFSWLLILLLLAAPLLSRLLQLGLSRTREFQADLEAAQLSGDPLGLARALRKIDSLSQGFWSRLLWPSPQASVPVPPLLRTHPETDERIRRLLELQEEKKPIPFTENSLATAFEQ